MYVRRVLLTVILVALVLAPLAVLMIRAFARSVIFPGSNLPFPAASELPAGVRVLGYASADGAPLAGAWWRSGQTEASTVIFFHGNAESAAQNLVLARGLAERGIDTFLPEYRGYGGLGGAATESHLIADAVAARAALEREGVDPRRVILVGRSLGTGVAVELATRGPCARLVLVSPYTSLVDLGRSMVGPLAPLLVPDRLDSLSKVARLGCPVTILHGTEDRTIPFAMGRRLADAIPGSLFVPLEGRGHNDIDLAPLLAEIVSRGEPAGPTSR